MSDKTQTNALVVLLCAKCGDGMRQANWGSYHRHCEQCGVWTSLGAYWPDKEPMIASIREVRLKAEKK